jgi:outer membrane protein assembly factor BamB
VLAGVLLLGTGRAAAQDWPQWRGPNRDSQVTGFTPPKVWPKTLTQKWKVTVGIGEASPALVGNKLFVFTRQGGDEVTTCLNAADGTIVWQDKYAAAPVTGAATGMGGLGPGTRSSPAVGRGKVCTFGAAGVVSCLDADSGMVVWRKDTKAHPIFFTRSSPLIVDGKCIVYIGGSNGALTSYDLTSGEVQWQWKGAGAPYGSPVLMTVADTRQVVTPTANSLAGIGLSDGKLLWHVKLSGDYQSTFGTPIVSGSTVLYSAPGKAGGGTIALQIEKQGDGFTATELWKKSLAGYIYNSPVLQDGLLFGVAADRKFFCMCAKTGDLLWANAANRDLGGAMVQANGVLLALTLDAQLVVFLPSGKAYTEVARYKVAESSTWAYPIVAGNRVFVKDREALTLWTIE